MSKVKVTVNPETGLVVNETSNPEVGYVRLEQTKEVINNGWFQDQRRSALVMGDPEKLEQRFKKGQTLPGTITIREDFTPAYNGQDPKINPQTKEVLTKDGQPIYRHSEYTSDPNAQDGEMIQHDTVEQGEAVETVESGEMSIT